MNKKDMILVEAKRLFGQYGYLGFTLKQLAQACDMTAPALYYFYTSKASLFQDCLLSELDARHALIRGCITQSTDFADFARQFPYDAIDICETHSFRVGAAMVEIIHLPEETQKELVDAYEQLLISPIETFLDQTLPTPIPHVSHRLVANLLINLATFISRQSQCYSREESLALFQVLAQGLINASQQAETPQGS